MAHLKQFWNRRIAIALIVTLPFALCLYCLVYTKWLDLQQSRPVNSMPDEWVGSPDQEMSSKPWSTINQDLIYEVPGDFLEEAVRLLSDASVAQLTEEQYKGFAGSNSKALNGDKAYLIRGVMERGTRLTGNFEVRQQGTT